MSWAGPSGSGDQGKECACKSEREEGKVNAVLKLRKRTKSLGKIGVFGWQKKTSKEKGELRTRVMLKNSRRKGKRKG